MSGFGLGFSEFSVWGLVTAFEVSGLARTWVSSWVTGVMTTLLVV